MRALLSALVLAAASCSTDPVATDLPAASDAVDIVLPDAPGAVDAGGAQPCTAGRMEECPCGDGRRGAQTCQANGAYGPCAGADAGSPMDVVVVADVVDAAAARGAVDVVDMDPRQTPECRGVTQTCDGRTVNVQGGERDGGLTYHCGRCGVTCSAGEFCVSCRCER
jgi:hypothetical protein